MCGVAGEALSNAGLIAGLPEANDCRRGADTGAPTCSSGFE
jgi:hypothetical protein